MDSTTSSTVNRQNTSATENSQNVLNNNNQQKSPTVSAHKNTVAPFISGIQRVQTKSMQGNLVGIQGFDQLQWYAAMLLSEFFWSTAT